MCCCPTGQARDEFPGAAWRGGKGHVEPGGQHWRWHGQLPGPPHAQPQKLPDEPSPPRHCQTSQLQGAVIMHNLPIICTVHINLVESSKHIQSDAIHKLSNICSTALCLIHNEIRQQTMKKLNQFHVLKLQLALRCASCHPFFSLCIFLSCRLNWPMPL